jgi:hypothetical protein
VDELPVRHEKSTRHLLQELDLSVVKKSGPILDNLKIFLSGFLKSEELFLTTVFKFAGATR